MDPISAEQLVGFRKMVRRLRKKTSFEHVWEIQQLRMFFKNCKETQEEYRALFTDALTPTRRSSVNLVSKAILDKLGIVDVEPSLELCENGEIKEVLDKDPHTDTKKLSGNAKVNEKVQ
ncbi:hypothetical protein DY000_02014838 [Brassica cretica]|uniref:Uncharacterized protein n=1 Tax=Brassica cretica TaxID=69181 RepID=A0ABQ7CXF9_BRACR|nr:hypothetical protein DY000_02014838 [Brassica cretica]